jgi:predicted O-methyltransferase YrrM
MPIPKPRHIEAQDPKYFAFRRDVLGWWVMWGGLSVATWLIWGDIAVIGSLVAFGGMVLWVMLRLYHKLQIEQFHHYWQTEALFSLYSAVPISKPLPPMRLWAASPDFVTLIVSAIKYNRPQVVFEVGSGISTIVTGYCLRELGSGRVLSLEHDRRFSQVTADNIIGHGLEDVAQVIYAPLKPTTIKTDIYLWYDLSVLENIPPIDLLVVDGPPEGTQRMARYPALPLLFSKLNDDAIVLVDDFMRDDEHKMVNEWLDEFKLTVIGSFANEKGAVILRKTAK